MALIKFCSAVILSVILCSLCQTLVNCEQQKKYVATEVEIEKHPKTWPEPPPVDWSILSSYTSQFLDNLPVMAQCKISTYLNVISYLVKLLQSQLYAIKFEFRGVVGIRAALDVINRLAMDASACVSELCRISHYEIVKDLFTNNEKSTNFTNYISKLSGQVRLGEDASMVSGLLDKSKVCTFKLYLLQIELTNIRVSGLALIEGTHLKQLYSKMVQALAFTIWYILDTLTEVTGTANGLQGYLEIKGSGKIAFEQVN